MAGLDPAIHVFLRRSKNVDARVKPGHDEWKKARRALTYLQGFESFTSNLPSAPEITKSL
jgi:hypothetical protein